MAAAREGHTPQHTVRIADDLWRAYGETVPDRGADLRAYVEWRVANPGRPLPRRRTPRPAAD